ncbi:MAG: peptidase and in kexin sedolisin [Frankiales bacterium]|nr:peptidase and in kexin sedolisin [Frankiales bacterium]
MTKRLRGLVPLVGLLAAAAVSLPSSPALARPSGVLDRGLPTSGAALQPVIVTGPSGPTALAQAVEAEGGTVGRLLPFVGGLSARVPAGALRDLADRPGVTAVTADRTGTVQAQGYDESTSASAFTWSSETAPVWPVSRGQGVGVAVLDTGVAPVADLSGRLVSGPDLSGSRAPEVDAYGHGTVMAGLVAGSGADGGSAPRTGSAPGARVISVKVAGENGATDVSTVLAAMHWVAAFREPYGIRVLNLSWGVPSTQDPRVDPLNHAVQRLWSLGITVVVAAGNSGPNAGTVLKPADDPLVLTVGAYDDKSDLVASNDSVPLWSSRGPTAQGLAKPDLVAPGRSLVSVRAPGSRIEQDNPKALVAPSYIRGSGTSQAAAVVSGAVAVLLGARPELTPDQVKAALVRSAVPLPGVDRATQGAGRLALRPAVQAGVGDVRPATPTATGTGSLDASRGAAPRVQVRCGDTTEVLDDETTSWCAPWDGASWTGASWTGASWTGASWTGASWTGASWTGSSFNGASWTGASWTGASWTGASWTDASWTGASWTGASWTGASWTSAVYEGEDTFLSAFWGARTPWWRSLPGELKEPAPAPCRRAASCR